jgi:DNA-directed RNA polymerase subunit RPC12/RpoP
MKKGDRVDCPECHHQTVVKEKVEMDGWKVGEKIFVCAFCGAKLGDESDGESKDALDKKAVSGLAALFDTEVEEGPAITEEEGDRHFCKYCEHYVFHAFVERCHLHKCEVTSMHSCTDFKAKKIEKKEKKDNGDEKPVF